LTALMLTSASAGLMGVDCTACVKEVGWVLSAPTDSGPDLVGAATLPRRFFEGLEVPLCELGNGSLDFVPTGECCSDPGTKARGKLAAEEMATRLGSEPLFVDGVGLCIAPFGLLTDVVSPTASSPPRLTMSFTFPTDALILVYSPLSPPWSSPAMPFESGPEEEDGGDVYSLKVVRVSLWLAVLWIWSSACERFSLSSCVVLAREADEPRRELRS